MIYPLDSVIHLSNNPGLVESTVDARVSCGTVASLTKLNTDPSETTERISGGSGRLFNLVS